MADRPPTQMELRILSALLNQPPKGENEPSQHYIMRSIKTTIRTMFEPTDEMWDASYDIGDGTLRGQWKVMIDAASPLEEGEGGKAENTPPV